MEQLIKRVLVVGSDAERLKLLAQRLRRNRFEVTSAGSSARLEAELVKTPFDIGIGVISARQEEPAWQLLSCSIEAGLPMVVLLAQDLGAEAEQRARAAGAGSLVREPYKIGDLQIALN